ncbi:MAG TPA: M12 family metallo-peptidase [Pirellulales bacterium]
MRFRVRVILVLSIASTLWLGLNDDRAAADVVILSNRSPAPVKFAAVCGQAKGKAYELAAGDLMRLNCRPTDRIRLAYMNEGRRKDFTLSPNSIYFFHRAKDSERLQLEQIALGEHDQADATAPPKASFGKTDRSPTETDDRPRMATVKVKILVDDDEKGVRSVWEERLRKRIDDASKIFEKYAGIKLEVVACDTWVTDNKIQDFDAQLREFEANVNPDPADLAIGFASQFSAVTGRTHLGGTRGPLAKHIMLREWSKQVSEPERLELLVHELGHHFGAAHSPEPTSVMRPILADRKALAKRFMITFDPVNALAMNLVASEIRDHQIERIYQVSPHTRDTLVSIYLTLGKALAQDPAANSYLAMLGEAPPTATRTSHSTSKTYVEGAQRVRDAIVNVADRNRRLPRTAPAEGGMVRVAGDALTEKYVRTAAYSAMQLPVAQRTKAFTLGLAVALGDTDLFLSNSLTRDLLASLETPEQRERRLEVIGAPTLLGRNDLARHYFFSAAMTALSSAPIAESAGLLKEMRDSQGESGFSFADLAADLAGIALGNFLKESESRLAQVARSYSVTEFMPPIDGLREGLDHARFLELFGSTSDPRFKEELDAVRTRVKQLPIYSATAATAEPPKKSADRR